MSEAEKPPPAPVLPGSGDVSDYTDQRDKPRRVFDRQTMQFITVPATDGSIEPEGPA